MLIKYPVSLNTKAIYNVLTGKRKRVPSCIEKWSEDYPGFHTAQTNLWSNIFRQPFIITRETKLQTFQYKLIYLLITCPKICYDMKLVANTVWLHCREIDLIAHFFLFCPNENQFWNTFVTWWNNLGDIQIPTQCECLEENILFGFQTEGDIFSSELLYIDSQISYLF